MSTHTSRARAQRLTVLLSGALVLLAAGVTAVAPGGRTITTEWPTWLSAAVLTVSFVLAEQLRMHIEFRRHAHTLTLSAIPLVVGALIAPVAVVVAARVLGAGVAMLVSRMRADKLVYNLAAYAFEAAVYAALVHALLGTGDPRIELPAAVTAICAFVVVDQMMNVLILLVIWLHNGVLKGRDVLEVLVPSAVLALTTSVAAIGLLLLVRDGVIGILVCCVAAFAAAILYRGYLTTRRRHQALELVHEFVNAGLGAESFTAAASDLLPRIRALLRAGVAQLTTVPTDSDGTALQITDSDDGFVVVDVLSAGLDWPTVRALSHDEPLLAPRTVRDRAVLGWLAERGYRDAMVTPLPANGTIAGTVVIADRLGETATFTDDDLTLLQTLTAQLAVAGTNARMIERLAYDANHDALTGLANRAHLRRRIDDARASGCVETGLVMLLDLDRFKEVNDALGHAAGDELLRVVANRLRVALPVEATVARLGGDEFAVYVPSVGDEQGALRLGERVREELAVPVHVDEAMVGAQASIGLALGSRSEGTDLLRQADTAMYAAKAEDLGIAVYRPDMDRGRVENLALLADLRTALREHPEQLMVYLQPKIDLRSRVLVSAEALVRWNHPHLGVVTPDRFIALAETSGLMDEFTPVVLELALREARRWNELGAPITVAVNISARNAGDRRLPRRIAEALARSDVAPERLIVEITESSVISEPEQALAVLDELAGLGVCVSLDDFGTGYSSLSYLQKLPASEVKIDRSFVGGLESDEPESSRALITAVTSLCTTLGKLVVAEGAESDAVLDELESLGCHVAQGYAISPPMSPDDFAEWLVRRRAAEGRVRLVRAV